MELNKRFFESLMAEKKLSLRGLAQRMGMNHYQLSLTFSGARRMTLDEAAKLSKMFGVPLHVIVENAGVSVKPIGGKRVNVIGSVQGDGTVELYEKGVIERTIAPDGIPEWAIAVQCRTSGSTLEWMDGAVLFSNETNGLEPAYMGRLCLCQIKGGPAVLALVKRGYKESTSNLSGPFQRESVTLEWATPILITRN